MERSRDVRTCPDKSEFQVAEAGSLLANKGATGELSWGGDGWCYSLSGSVPREDLEKIAASVKPMPYREGVIPPYEYQPPAHPLVRTFSVNRRLDNKRCDRHGRVPHVYSGTVRCEDPRWHRVIAFSIPRSGRDDHAPRRLQPERRMAGG